MRMLSEYYWAQDKVEEIVTGKKHAETKACERRLRQMKAKREKDEKRKEAIRSLKEETK